MPLLEIQDLVTAFHTPAGRVPAVDGVSLAIEPGRTLGLVGESGCGKSVTAMSVLRLVAAPGRIESGRILLAGRRGSGPGGPVDLVRLPERELRRVRGGRIGMIFQEPTTALDVTIQAQILDLLADLRRRLGTAILLITHDLGVVAETCDEVAVMYAGRIVERGPAATIFSRPLHPYTIGLLAAKPDPTAPRGGPLRTIPGMVPPPQEFPAGCRFHPRCAYARRGVADAAACDAAVPELREVEPGHFVRCHYAGELGPETAASAATGGAA